MIPFHQVCSRYLIDRAKSERLASEGWRKSDLHVHSSCSPDVVPVPEHHPEAIYRTAVANGMDYVSITDHDTMDAYDLIGWEREGLVPGVEISLHDGERVGHTIHVNVYELNRTQFERLMEIAWNERNVETFVSYLNGEGLPFIYNHPFWFSKFDVPNVKSILKLAKMFPVVEYNMQQIRPLNWLAMQLAAFAGKGVMANTDTHIAEVGAACTVARGGTFRAFFDNVAAGHSYIVPKDMTEESLTREVLAYIHALFSASGIQERKLQISRIDLVDRFIQFILQNHRNRYPVSFPLIEQSVRRFIKTGWVTGLYIHSQNKLAQSLASQLRFPSLQYDIPTAANAVSPLTPAV